jgi:ATP-dependent DNA helicase RecQ
LLTPTDTLKKYWGYHSFRPGQLEIISHCLSGNDTLALLPTGGGKSICFQVPILCGNGMGLVISPLIALMNDQVQHLLNKNIAAVALTSALSSYDVDQTLKQAIAGKIKFLYVSPERLSSEVFLSALEKLPVKLIAVDEAHCVSQWGYDFRPAYLNIAKIRPYLPNAPILALTATATPDVVIDIQSKLAFKAQAVFKNSFARKNLSYRVMHVSDKKACILYLLNHFPGSAILYSRNRKGTKLMSEWLNAEGISSDFYHAGLVHEERNERQHKWVSGESRVMVATNAFGMGIDKPDVRLVIHTDLPDSPEAYFQEAGRAGRDELPAVSYLLINENDKHLFLDNLSRSYPSPQVIKKVYEQVMQISGISYGEGMGYTLQLNPNELCKEIQLPITVWTNAIRLLEKDGYWHMPAPEKSIDKIFIPHPPHLFRTSKTPAHLEELKQQLLRLYSGIFDDFTPVYLDKIASLLEWSILEVKQGLAEMHKLHLLKYIPALESGFYVQLLANRIASNSVMLSEEHYFQRKKMAQHKADAMISFAWAENKCRAVILLSYFGENNAEDCGTCDICVRKEPGREPIQLLEELNNPVDLTTLLWHIPELSLNDFSLLRIWIQNGTIIKDKNGKYKKGF